MAMAMAIETVARSGPATASPPSDVSTPSIREIDMYVLGMHLHVRLISAGIRRIRRSATSNSAMPQTEMLFQARDLDPALTTAP
jgi:hypothetical protein